MITKGLKKGEVFEDGGLYFEVQSVLPNGHYVSKRVDVPKEEAEETGGEESPVEEVAEETMEEATQKTRGKRK